MSALLRQARLLRNWWKLRDIGWARQFLDAGLPADAGSVSSERKCRLAALDVELSPEGFARFADGYKYAASLKAAGARFAAEPDGALAANVGGLNLRVETAEELFILHEIFVVGAYRLSAAGPMHVLDIGANAGFASLSFAALPFVTAVRSYEPFPQTAVAARANFDRNPHVKDKIRLEQAAVWSAAAEFHWKYAPNVRGSVGGFHAPQLDRPGVDSERVRVVARDAADVVSSACQEHPGVALAVKLDCEGSEYAIVERLHAAGLLTAARAYLIEWHILADDHRPARLLEPLRSAGFDAVWHGGLHERVGMIYAFKTASSASRTT